MTAQELAKACQIESARLEPVLVALGGTGWLDVDGGRYSLSRPLRAGAGPFGDLDPVRRSDQLWRQATQWLRRGEPAFAMLDESGEAYADVVDELADASAAAAVTLASALVDGGWATDGASIIDIGAGAGTWSLPLLARLPAALLTIVDRPLVAEKSLQRVSSLGLADRLAVGPYDWRDVGLGTSAHGLAMLGNICHLFGADDAAALICRAAATLAPGGAVVIVPGSLQLGSTR